jgi:hypothetical protein
MDDGQFLDQLSPGASGPIGTPELDRRRMAKLLFSLGATLGSGKANVRMLQGAMHMRGASATSGRGIVAESYTGYDLTVERFRVQVSAFLDRPDSDPLLFETLSDGHEVCWRLDAYTRLVESYGVSVQIMVSILASREACNQFRRAAFSRPVQRTIVSALEDAEQQTEQLQDLRDEIASLEQLVEDLREIEER